MAERLQTEATHVVKWDDLKAWLAEYGIDVEVDYVASLALRLDSETAGIKPREHGVCMWLDVTWCKRGPGGDPYGNVDRSAVETGQSSIPLRSWPPLTQA